jgi:hypothetical protein
MMTDTVVRTVHDHFARQATPEVWAEVDALRTTLRKLDGYMMGALDCRVSAAGWQGIVTDWRNEIAEALAETPNPSPESEA